MAGQPLSPHQALQQAQPETEILLRLETVFPFDFFPDTLMVDRSKITLIKRDFFQSGRVSSVPINDMLEVKVNVGPLFAQVELINIMTMAKLGHLEYVNKADALRLRELVQGLMIGMKRGVDLDKIQRQELVTTAEELGAVQE